MKTALEQATELANHINQATKSMRSLDILSEVFLGLWVGCGTLLALTTPLGLAPVVIGVTVFGGMLCFAGLRAAITIIRLLMAILERL